MCKDKRFATLSPEYKFTISSMTYTFIEIKIAFEDILFEVSFPVVSSDFEIEGKLDFVAYIPPKSTIKLSMTSLNMETVLEINNVE